MIRRESVKDYVQLISKKLRIEETSDYVPTYYYDYKIKFYETDEVHRICVERCDLEKDFNDNDYDFILRYVNQLK